MNMKNWLREVGEAKRKKAMPILSFPCVQLINVSVKELVNSSELQAKGMKAIADRYDTLASVSMMDLSVEAEAFGAKIRFSENEVPSVEETLLKSSEDVDDLKIPDVSAARCSLYVDTVKKAKELITDRPVFAGVIGPFSLVGRLMDVSEAMINCYVEPEMVHKSLQKATAFLIKYISEYKKIGANGVVMAEPLTGMLSPDLAREFSETYVREIVESVQSDDFIVIYHNCGNNINLMADSIFATKAAAFHFGNSVPIGEMLVRAPENTIIMGNVDPAGCIRAGTPETVKDETLRIMTENKDNLNFVISSGCDIPHDSSIENIDAFFKAVDLFYGK